jgi:heparosan-N-sulfate-glucuronate 5-epimerase
MLQGTANTTTARRLTGRGLRHVAYLARAIEVYARPSAGPLSFWYESPESNPAAVPTGPQYFMRFQGKAAYAGPFDDSGIPLLDYRGDIGRQYNPIAIAQYGLARFNRWCETRADADRRRWMNVAEWLAGHLQPNAHGVRVWFHHFDWPYRELLQAPWYSGLAQGNGLSMLVRAAAATGDPSFATAAHEAFESFERPVSSGGVILTDERGDVWIEEYLVDPPSHILNGFIWAAWGVYDYANWSGREQASRLWERCVETLERRLHEFDVGWWSLYESPHGGRRMLASPYYHRLHITQLEVLHQLTRRRAFADAAARFASYERNRLYRARAVAEKGWFKFRHY